MHLIHVTNCSMERIALTFQLFSPHRRALIFLHHLLYLPGQCPLDRFMPLKIKLVEYSHLLLSVLLDDVAIDRSRSISKTQYWEIGSRSFLLPNCPVQEEFSIVIIAWNRHCLVPRQRHRGGIDRQLPRQRHRRLGFLP